jgi:pilus assembly protein CpaE
MTETGNSKSGEGDPRQAPELSTKTVLSIALIGPNDDRRKSFMTVLSLRENVQIHEFTSFPPNLDELPRTVGERYDVVILDVDSDPDYVFNLVERICANSAASVMVYSAQPDVKQAVRFMRAGTREYFTLPVSSAELGSALARAAAHPPAVPVVTSKPDGQVFVFLGAKGGCGVTSLAANFAMLVATETSQSTLLIDFGQPLGDAGINLGMPTANYSTANALQDSSRLDSRFLSSLIVKHSSGLALLAAPGDFSSDEVTLEGVDKLVEVARQDFNYVIVDAGSRTDLMETKLFDESSIVYLITQVGISELRNSNRLISRYFSLRIRSLQIVLNRYTHKALLFDDAQITKALTRPANWKVPDDYATARRTEASGTPIALEDSPISLTLRQMARAACGIVEDKTKKKSFSFFRK